MAKAPSIEERLAELAKLRDHPNAPEARKELRKHLSSKISLVVARAAQIVADSADSELVPDLIAAFHRFTVKPATTDKGCLAKTAVVKALLAAGCEKEEIFLEGIRHVQLEPAYGGPTDTAAELRALSGLGLVQTGWPEALNELVTLLADREADARIGAAYALSQCGREAEPLLRLKALTGDSETAVLAECLTGLMRLSPRTSLSFVASFVDRANASLSEAAALAIGESRVAGAFALLKEKWDRIFDPQFRQMLLLPMALTRSEAAREFLLAVLETNNVKLASAALAALRIYRDDSTVRERIESVIGGRNEAELRKLFRREFE